MPLLEERDRLRAAAAYGAAGVMLLMLRAIAESTINGQGIAPEAERVYATMHRALLQATRLLAPSPLFDDVGLMLEKLIVAEGEWLHERCTGSPQAQLAAMAEVLEAKYILDMAIERLAQRIGLVE